jgi:hypothetical protein
VCSIGASARGDAKASPAASSRVRSVLAFGRNRDGDPRPEGCRLTVMDWQFVHNRD